MRVQEIIRLAEGVESVSAIFPIAGFQNHLRPHGISVDIAHQRQGMFIGIHGNAFVSAHPEMALSLLALIVVVRKMPIDRVHGLSQGDLWGRLQEEVNVRIHNLVIEEPELVLLLEQSQHSQIDLKILVRFKMKGAVITTGNDVIMKVTFLNARLPGHAK